MTNAGPWWEKSKATVFLACNSWLNFCVRGQFEIKILIVRHINSTYFMWIFLKKIKLEPTIIWKLVTCQRITSKKIELDGSTPEPAKPSGDNGQRIPYFDSCQLIKHWRAICVQYQFSCVPKLARKCEIEDWLPCGTDGRVGCARAGRRCTVTWLPNYLGCVD